MFFNEKKINEIFKMFFNEPTDSDNWELKTFKSEDGTMTIRRWTRKSKSENNLISSEIKELENLLSECVLKEEYEKAIEFRDKIKHLKSINEEVTKLEKEKNLLVDSENYEEALKLRDKINELKTKNGNSKK